MNSAVNEGIIKGKESMEEMCFSRLIGVFLTVLLVLSASGCKQKQTNEAFSQGQTIRIGEVGSLSGSEATFGISTHQGIQLAIDEINKANGIGGKKLELITLDDQSKSDEAATATTQLITQKKVSAVLGEVASSRSMAMAAIAQDYKVPMISPSSTNPKVTALGDFIFRVCFIDPFQGEVLAKFVLQELKFKKAVVLRDVKSDYSTGLTEFFVKEFKKGGGEILIEESYGTGDIDFKAQLTAARAKSPDVLFVPGYYTEVGLIARQARELGIHAPLIGGDGWDSPKLVEIGGKALEGSYFSNHYSSENQAPEIQEFVSKFKKEYGVVPGGFSAMGYDAVNVLAQALREVLERNPNHPNPELKSVDLKNALAKIRNFPGVTGKISIDQKRNAMKPAVVLKIENGLFKYRSTVQPE